MSEYGLQKPDAPKPSEIDNQPEPEIFSVISECHEATQRACLMFDMTWRNKGIGADRILVSGNEITVSDGYRAFKFRTERPLVYLALKAWTEARPFPNNTITATPELSISQLREIAVILFDLMKASADCENKETST